MENTAGLAEAAEAHDLVAIVARDDEAVRAGGDRQVAAQLAVPPNVTTPADEIDWTTRPVPLVAATPVDSVTMSSVSPTRTYCGYLAVPVVTVEAPEVVARLDSTAPISGLYHWRFRPLDMSVATVFILRETSCSNAPCSLLETSSMTSVHSSA